MNNESTKKQLKDIMAEIQDMAVEHLEQIEDNGLTALQVLKLSIEVYENYLEENEG